MTLEEKDILRKLISKGVISPADMNGLVQRNNGLLHLLIASGYIEEVPTTVNGYPSGTYKQINFYRATEKAHAAFYSYGKKFWFWVKDDMRTVIVSVVSSVITTAVITFLALQN